MWRKLSEENVGETVVQSFIYVLSIILLKEHDRKLLRGKKSFLSEIFSETFSETHF